MQNIKVTSLLIERLEHIPADSIWAHRASGVRRSLSRMIECFEAGLALDSQNVEELYHLGFQILEQAAKEKS
jgi:hypothetical protein